MELRQALPSDLDRIMEVLDEGRASLAALGIDQWQGHYPHRGQIEQDIRRGENVVIVDDDGLIVATAMVATVDAKDYDEIKDGEWLTESQGEPLRCAVVQRVAVSTACIQSGLATRIMTYAFDYAREMGCESVRLNTHSGNIPMQRLLEKQGYTRCGTITIGHVEGTDPERYAYEKLVY